MSILYSYAADRTSDKREAFLHAEEPDEHAPCPECGDVTDHVTSPYHGGLWRGCGCGWREAGWYGETKQTTAA